MVVVIGILTFIIVFMMIMILCIEDDRNQALISQDVRDGFRICKTGNDLYIVQSYESNIEKFEWVDFGRYYRTYDAALRFQNKLIKKTNKILLQKERYVCTTPPNPYYD